LLSGSLLLPLLFLLSLLTVVVAVALFVVFLALLFSIRLVRGPELTGRFPERGALAVAAF